MNGTFKNTVDTIFHYSKRVAQGAAGVTMPGGVQEKIRHGA